MRQARARLTRHLLFDVTLAFALIGLGETDEARMRLGQATEPAHEIGGAAFSALCLDGLAAIAVAREHPLDAACLSGAAEALRRHGGVQALRAEQRRADET